MSLTMRVLLLVAMALCVRAAHLNLGVGRLDEINGITHPRVSIPTLASEVVQTDAIQGESIQAARPSGFSLTASGPIDFQSSSGTTISTETVVAVGAGGVGTLETSHETTSFSAVDAQFGGVSHVVRSAGSVTLSNPEGTVFTDSFLHTSFESVSNTLVSSTFGDIQVDSAGAAHVNGLSIDIDIGDPIDDEAAHITAQRDVTVHTAGEFSTDTRGKLTVTGDRNIQITSDDAFLTFESGDVLAVTSTTSDVDFITQQDMVIKSILGEIAVTSNNVVSMNGFTVEVSATDDVTINADSFQAVSNGETKLSATSSLQFDYQSLSMEARNDIKFITQNDLSLITTNGEFTAPRVNILADRDDGAILFDAVAHTWSAGVTVDLKAELLDIDTENFAAHGHTVVVRTGEQRLVSHRLYEDGDLHVQNPTEYEFDTIDTEWRAHSIEFNAMPELRSSAAAQHWTAHRVGTVSAITLEVDASTEFNVEGGVDLSGDARDGVLISADTSFSSSANETSHFGAGSLIDIRGASNLFTATADASFHAGSIASTSSGLTAFSTTGGAAASTNLNVEAATGHQGEGIGINGDTVLFASTATYTGNVGWFHAYGDGDDGAEFVRVNTTTASVTAERDVIGRFADLDFTTTALTSTSLNHDVRGMSFSIDAGSVSFTTDDATNIEAGGEFVLQSDTDVTFIATSSINILADDKPLDNVHFQFDDKATVAANSTASIHGGSVDVLLSDTLLLTQDIAVFDGRWDTSVAATATLTFNVEDAFAHVTGLELDIDANNMAYVVDQTMTVEANDVEQNLFANALQDIDFFTDSVLYTADNMVYSGGMAQISADNVNVDASVQVQFLSSGDLEADAPLMTFKSTGSTNIFGDISTTITTEKTVLEIESCADDVTMRAESLSTRAGGDIHIRQEKICEQQGDSYRIVLEADDGKATGDASFVWFNATTELVVLGGEISFESTEEDREQGNIDITSPNQITINSVGGPAEVDHGDREDRYSAPQGVLDFFATNHFKMQAFGRDENDGFQDYGMLLDTTGDNDFNIEVRAGSFIGNSGQGFRFSTANDEVSAVDPQDVSVHAQRDIFFHSQNGAFSVDAGGFLDETTEGVASTGVLVHAVEGDVLIESHAAFIGVDAFAGVDVLSQFGPFTFRVTDDMEHRATIVEESTITYNAPSGDIAVTAGQDITLGGGTDSTSGDVNIIALDTLTVSSGQNQRYHQNGPSSTIDHDAVELISTFGDVAVKAADDLQFDAAGHVTFDAKVKEMNIAVFEDISFVSDASRVNVNSARDLLLESSEGGIDIAADGGGGSVSIISDSNQNLVIDTNRNGIFHKSRDFVEYFANTGVTGRSREGSMSMSTEESALFHSSGKVVLQSLGVRTAPSDGVQIAGHDISVDVLHDMLIDGDFVTVGRVSAVSSATDPLVHINAGGDDTTNGVELHSNGNVRFSTRGERSNVHFTARDFDVDGVNGITMDSNGAMGFRTTAIDDNGEFAIDAFAGNFEVFGKNSAEFHAHDELLMTTNGYVKVEASSRTGANGIFVDSARDMNVIAEQLWDVSVLNLGEYDFDDMTVVAGDISIRNTPGLRGTLEFDADEFMLLEAGSDMLFETQGDSPLLISTRGDYSSISFAAEDVRGGTTATLNLNSGDSIVLAGNNVDIDGRVSIAFSAPQSGATVAASDDVLLVFNETLAMESLKVFTVDAGESIFASSDGTLVMNAQSDVLITTDLDEKSEVRVTADGDLHIFNFENPVRSQRGEARLESDEDALFASVNGDSSYTAGDEILIRIGGMDFTGANGLNLLSDNPSGGTMHFTAQDFVLEAENETGRFAAGNAANALGGDLHVTTDSFAIDGAFEHVGNQAEIVGGDDVTLAAVDMDIVAAVGATFTSGGSTNVTAGTSNVNSEYDIFVSTSTSGGSGDAKFTVAEEVTFLADFVNADSLGTDGSEGFVSFEVPGDSVFAFTTFATLTGGHDLEVNGGTLLDVDVENQLLIDSQDIHIVSAGRDSAADTGYGVLLDSDAKTTFNVNDIFLNSGAGSVSLTASEVTTATAEVQASFHASNQLRVSSGFDATPMSEFADTIGIEMEATNGDITMLSLRDDILIDGFDISFASNQLFIEMDSEDDGRVSFLSRNDARGESTGTTTLESRDRSRIEAVDSIEFLAVNGMTFNILKDVVIESTGGNVEFRAVALPINVFGRDGVVLDAPGGVVDFQDENADIVTLPYQTMRLPSLQFEAGVIAAGYTQNGDLRTQELNVPGCVNRQLGVSENDDSLCVCDRHKWRCTLGFSP